MGSTMLTEDVRSAILTLHARGHGPRAIARDLRISRNSVKEVLKSGRKSVPPRERASVLDPHRAVIGALYLECRGNIVRVHEELQAREGVTASYQALTAFCRRQRIGVVDKPPAGEYDFQPGQEMQHDTSPHVVEIGGKKRHVECASLVLCYSRRFFAQVYTRFRRFECKVFLTDAARHFGCVAETCMIDNTHVVVLEGTGKSAIMVPEAADFADRLGFKFAAHELGHADRKGRVERRFDYIDTNFYPGRTFADLADLNRQLIAWCERDFARFRDDLGAAPRDLFATEAPSLKPLPLHVPDVYRLEHRQVDSQGYVHLDTNRYSAPWRTVDHWLDVHEYKDRVELVDGLDIVAVHPRHEPGAHQKSQLPEHKRPTGMSRRDERKAPAPAETRLRSSGPAFVAMVDLLRQKLPGRAVRALQRLEALRRDYPAEPLVAALEEAVQYGLTDLYRIERMVLRRVAGDFFNLLENRKDPKK